MNIQLNYQESLTFHMDEHSVELSGKPNFPYGMNIQLNYQESLTFHMDEHSVKLSGKPNFPYG